MRFLNRLRTAIILSCTSILGASTAAAISDKNEACMRVLRSVVQHYQELVPLLPAHKKPLPLLQQMLALKASDCRAGASGERSLALMNTALSEHRRKVGLILPLSGSQERKGQTILEGVQSAFAEAPNSFGSTVIVRSSGSEVDRLRRAVAELVLSEGITMLMGGIGKAEALIMREYAERLLIPTLILAPPPTTKQAIHAFYVYPDQASLAQVLAHYAKTRGLQRIAIISPEQPSHTSLISLLRPAIEAQGLSLMQALSYQGEDYNSVEATLRKLLKIDDPARAPEREALFESKKTEAEAAHLSFQARNIMLPPLIEFDALIILDNFRMVRHLAKTLRYLGVRELPLLGTQEWRARSLVETPEPLLLGAVFADFIGSYKSLPPGLDVESATDSAYFATPEQMAKLDQRLIGRRAMAIALSLLQSGPERRRKLAGILANLTEPLSETFAAGKAFNAQQRSRWPAQLFRVEAGTIVALALSASKESSKATTEGISGQALLSPF